MRINGRRVWGTCIRVEFFTRSRSRHGERTIYPFDLWPNGDMRCIVDTVKNEIYQSSVAMFGLSRFFLCLGGGWCEYGEVVVCAKIVVTVCSTEAGSR